MFLFALILFVNVAVGSVFHKPLPSRPQYSSLMFPDRVLIEFIPATTSGTETTNTIMWVMHFRKYIYSLLGFRSTKRKKNLIGSLRFPSVSVFLYVLEDKLRLCSIGILVPWDYEVGEMKYKNIRVKLRTSFFSWVKNIN